MRALDNNSAIFVTGADGFIGSHLTEALVRKGYKVRALVQYNSFNSWGWLEHCAPEVLTELEVVTGDIRDSYGIKKAMAGCSGVLHLAALIAIPFSYNSPDLYIDTNVKGTLNVLQAARELGISKFVHTSTSEVYGSAQFVPINENHPLQGQSPYSASKIAADQLVHSFYCSFELPTITIRPFNTYGPRQSARAIIPAVITQIAAGRDQIMLGSTSPTRDFTFVSDTVLGFIAALEANVGLGETFNLGSNFEISIAETAKMIALSMNSKVNFIEDENRLRPDKSEVQRLWADNTKAIDILNWKPNYFGKEGFKRGIQETVKWFQDYNHSKQYKPNLYNI